jgi:hypothetical protein
MTTQSLTGSALVTKGQSTIQFLIRVWEDPWQNVAQMNNGTAPSSTYTLNDGYTNAVYDILAVNVCGVHRKR